MKSPESHHKKEKGEKKVSYRRREHKNKKFYNSKAWKDTREAYLRHYENRLHQSLKNYKWEGMGVEPHKVSYILSLDFLPCESCLKHFAADAYDKVEPGKELDHIEPVNPDNALDQWEFITTRLDGTGDLKIFGDPFDFQNLQYLCKRHHAKKSQRERN